LEEALRFSFLKMLKVLFEPFATHHTASKAGKGQRFGSALP
jgi:hypothetical protein